MTRTILFLSVLIVVLTLPAQAQLVKHWGLIGGLTSSDHVWNGNVSMEDRQKRQSGFHAGVFLEWLDIPYFSVVTQLSYVQKGVGLEWEYQSYEEPLGTGEFFTAHARLDYLSLAVLAKASVPSSLISPYVVAGPRLDILLDHASDHYLSLASLYELFDPTVLGLSVGAGLQTRCLFSALFFLQFRYEIDLHDSFKSYGDLFHTKVKNSSFDISAGIGF